MRITTRSARSSIASGWSAEKSKRRRCAEASRRGSAGRCRPVGCLAEPKERRERLCNRARDYLRHPSIANEKVYTYGEIQIILEPDARVRKAMHLVYKVVRAETGVQLYDAFWQSYGKRPVEVNADVLYSAAYRGQFSVAEALLDSGANVDVGHSDGRTPLHVAAERNHPDVLQLLIDRGASVNKPDNNGSTPLFAAAQHNFLDVTKMLISNNAAIDQGNNNGATPLHIASQYILESSSFSFSAIDQVEKNGRVPLNVLSRYEGKCGNRQRACGGWG